VAEPARNKSPAWCGPAVAPASNELASSSRGLPAATAVTLASDGSSLVQGLALGPSPAHTPLPGLGLAAGSAGSAVATSGAMAAGVPTFPQQPAGGGDVTSPLALPPAKAIELVHGEGCAPSPAHEVCSTDAERADAVKVSTVAMVRPRLAGVVGGSAGLNSAAGGGGPAPEQQKGPVAGERSVESCEPAPHTANVSISPTGLDPRHTSQIEDHSEDSCLGCGATLCAELVPYDPGTGEQLHETRDYCPACGFVPAIRPAAAAGFPAVDGLAAALADYDLSPPPFTEDDIAF
jgi:hypothetical protein